MKKKIRLIVIHRIFRIGVLLILGAFCAFLAYVYLAFNGPITGVVRTGLRPELLMNLQTKKLEMLVGRLEKRRALPDIPLNLPDPFDGALIP